MRRKNRVYQADILALLHAVVHNYSYEVNIGSNKSWETNPALQHLWNFHRNQNLVTESGPLRSFGSANIVPCSEKKT